MIGRNKDGDQDLYEAQDYPQDVKKINNIGDLVNNLISAFEDLQSGKIDVGTAIAMSKMADTSMSALKLQMQYQSIGGNTPRIKFLDDGSAIEHDSLLSLE